MTAFRQPALRTKRVRKQCCHLMSCVIVVRNSYSTVSTQNTANSDGELFYQSGYQALQKKHHRNKLTKIEWRPEHLSLAENQWIYEATKPYEVRNILDAALKNKDLSDATKNGIFSSAIRKCIELRAYAQCWDLFALSKSTNHLSKHTYSTMIWMLCNSPRRLHFTHALDLYAEMKESGITPSVHTYSILLDGCAKKLLYEQGLQIWTDLQSNQHITVDTVLWNSILKLHVFNTNMDAAEQCYGDMQHKALLAPDYYTFATLLNGYSCCIAKALKQHMKHVDVDEYLVRADNVFYDAVMCWQQQPQPQQHNEAEEQARESADIGKRRLPVIQAWLNVYAAYRDLDAVLTIFQWLLQRNGIAFEFKASTQTEKVSDMKEWLSDAENVLNTASYALTPHIFGIVLKTMVYHEPLKEAKLHQLLRSIITALDENCTFMPSPPIYANLFQLYARMVRTVDVSDLEELYETMKSKCYPKPTELELNAYARAYLAFLEHAGARKMDKQDFLEWILREFRTLQITPSIYTKQLIAKYSD